MPEALRRNLSIVLRRILRQPFSIAVISVSLLLALLNHGPAVTLVFTGAITCLLIYIVTKLQNEEFIRDSIREHIEHKRKDDLLNRMFRVEELDLDSRVKMKSLVKLQGEISEDILNFPISSGALGLSDTVDYTEKLLDRGLQLAQKHRELQRYLSKTDADEITHRIDELNAKSGNNMDSPPEVTKALAAKTQELEDYHAIQKSANMILDQLDSIECCFSGLRGRLMRIRSTDITQWASAQDELLGELGGLNSAVDVVERSITEVLSIKNI